jgi:hypothetical protein
MIAICVSNNREKPMRHEDAHLVILKKFVANLFEVLPKLPIARLLRYLFNSLDPVLDEVRKI